MSAATTIPAVTSPVDDAAFALLNDARPPCEATTQRRPLWLLPWRDVATCRRPATRVLHLHCGCGHESRALICTEHADTAQGARIVCRCGWVLTAAQVDVERL